MLDRASGEEDVIVERYGAPRVAIVAYRRYEVLVNAEHELLRVRLHQTFAAAAERAAELGDTDIDLLIEDARSKVLSNYPVINGFGWPYGC